MNGASWGCAANGPDTLFCRCHGVKWYLGAVLTAFFWFLET